MSRRCLPPLLLDCEQLPVSFCQFDLLLTNGGADAITGAMCAPNIFRSSFSNWQPGYAMGEVMAKKGIKKVFVSTPGFTSDCLETIDEIGHEAKEVFVEAGGEELFQCPCLNDHPAWIEAMKTIVDEEGAGWL